MYENMSKWKWLSITCKPSWSTARAAYRGVVLRGSCGTRRFILQYMICRLVRPSSTFTVLAISNVELWRWWWLPLGRIVEVVVEHEGLYFYVLCGYLYILRGLLIVTRYIRVNVQMEMVVTCKPSWSTSRASYWEVVLRRACGTRRFILLYTMWVS